MTNAVVVFSGGMDSLTVLHRAIKDHGAIAVHALSIHYGQRHRKELDAARAAATALGVEHRVVDLSVLRDVLSASSLTSDQPVPEGHYADESMKQTVVPNRNMILLSVAAGYAMSLGASEVWAGFHSGDHAIYPDCRPLFVGRMREVLDIAGYKPVELVVPFIHDDKADILREGLRMGADYALSWTCYNGREKACGRCGSCVERLEAFAQNLAIDPLTYEIPRNTRPDYLACDEE